MIGHPPGNHHDDLALLKAGFETGFWDETGQPAPWPDDFDEWRLTSSEPITPGSGQPPF